jgi:hypothetical protein
MDVSSVLSMAGAMQTQKLSQVQLETTLKSEKSFMDLQKSVVAQLLASLPSVNPDGVGGRLDITA